MAEVYSVQQPFCYNPCHRLMSTRASMPSKRAISSSLKKERAAHFFSFCFSSLGARVTWGRWSVSKKDWVACVTASFIAWGAWRCAVGATTVCSGRSPAGWAMTRATASATSWGSGGVAERFSAKNGVVNASVAA